MMKITAHVRTRSWWDHQQHGDGPPAKAKQRAPSNTGKPHIQLHLMVQLFQPDGVVAAWVDNFGVRLSCTSVSEWVSGSLVVALGKLKEGALTAHVGRSPFTINVAAALTGADPLAGCCC
jgi:hypothetical protein